jgi:hypothetical protein
MAAANTVRGAVKSTLVVAMVAMLLFATQFTSAQTAISEEYATNLNRRLDTVYDEDDDDGTEKSKVEERGDSPSKQYAFSLLGQGFLGVYTLGT